MILAQYQEIRKTHLTETNLPEEFFLPSADGTEYCIFMISCLSKDKFIYLDQNFTAITGYPNSVFVEGGMDFWMSLICPDDMEAVTSHIIAAHQAMFSPGYDPYNPPPLILEYRFKHAHGHWTDIRDTRYLVSVNTDKIIDKVLCRFELLASKATDLNTLADLLQKERSCTRMLEQAMVHQNSKNKQALTNERAASANPAFVNDLTKREKEILQLIGQGLSTKMIADQCCISIHTVETHRRHLLEKLQVKNSMQLIKEASKVFWL